MAQGCCQSNKRRESIPHESIIDEGCKEVLNCVRQLELKEKLFANYLDDEQHKGSIEHNMLEHINVTLSEIFNCPVQLLEEQSIAIVAVHAFYRSDELYDKWIQCKFPLFGGLLVCYILRTMRRIFEGVNEFSLVEAYRKSYGEFEDNVLEILEVSYRRDESKTMSTLKVKYNDLIKRKSPYASACSVLYLIDLAMMAKCEKILDHNTCRRITNERWTPKINISRMHFILAFLTVIPVFRIPFNHTQAKRRREGLSIRKKLRIFYCSPCGKFCSHTLSYLIYIVVYAWVLLRSSKIDFRFFKSISNEMRASDMFFHYSPEILLWVWQIAYLLESVDSWFTVGFNRIFSRNPADMTHNILNLSWAFLGFCSLILKEGKRFSRLWGMLSVISKLLFIVSFIFSSIRIMRIFAADSFFGSIVVMMKKMVSTLWSFLVVIVLFWGTYAIAIVSLQVSDTNLAWNIFSNGAFEIFGELKEARRDGEITDCPKLFNSSDIRDFTIDCAFRTWMIPILLFIYVLVSSVLLVNLVTSFFTNTYEQVRDSSMLHYRYKHYQRLFEFEQKFSLPAPFSIIYYLPRVACAFIKCCTELFVCDCCAKCYIYCNQSEEDNRSTAPDSILLVPVQSEPEKKSEETALVVEKEHDGNTREEQKPRINRYAREVAEPTGQATKQKKSNREAACKKEGENATINVEDEM